jgi:galactokinase
MTTLIAPAAEEFRTAFAVSPAVIAVAPGRVNLIGEHTDYNEGLVLPAAIDRFVAVAVGPAEPGTLHLHSRLHGSRVRLAASAPLQTGEIWATYIAAVYDLLVPRELRERGVSLSVVSDLPAGAGLGSSAALEVAVCYALATWLEIPGSAAERIALCRRAETDIVGVGCGIMDQFASVAARAGHALFLDCRSLAFEHVPFPKSLAIMICHSGVERDLRSSAFNERRRECAEAVRILRAHDPHIRALRDVTMEDLRAAMRRLPPPLHRRVRHVVTENCRVRETAAALRACDPGRIGKMLYDSHLSLRNQYEASCPELDAIVDICAKQEGVVGARMTGAGFGGAAVCIAAAEAASELAERLRRDYPAATGRAPTILRCRPSGGVSTRTT